MAASTTKTVAIVQSCYIPWKGYFDLIKSADEFILLDDVQYTRRDWRNRNRIKTKSGLLWLSIPVEARGHYHDRIRDITVSQRTWGQRHWASIAANYARARYFTTYAPLLRDLYLDDDDVHLSRINFRFLRRICDILGISTKITWSSDYEVRPGRTERLVSLCRQVGATRYLSGPSAKDYLETRLFEKEGIDVAFFDYAGYPEYPQLFPPFAHQVSIIDLILNVGPDAPRYMLSF